MWVKEEAALELLLQKQIEGFRSRVEISKEARGDIDFSPGLVRFRPEFIFSCNLSELPNRIREIQTIFTARRNYNGV